MEKRPLPSVGAEILFVAFVTGATTFIISLFTTLLYIPFLLLFIYIPKLYLIWAMLTSFCVITTLKFFKGIGRALEQEFSTLREHWLLSVMKNRWYAVFLLCLQTCGILAFVGLVIF